MRTHLLSVTTAALLAHCPPAQSPGRVVINEVCADNRSGLSDEDGYAADWIELHNPADTAADLDGYTMVDGSERTFTFPPARIDPHGYLLLFASGKQRARPGQPLHAGFRLSRKGEQLQLRAPDGTPVSEFSFADQLPDVSCGWAQDYRQFEWLATDAVANYLVPTSAPDPAWRQPEFDATAWQSGRNGFGFDARASGAVTSVLSTDLSAAVRGQASTICYRFPFDAIAGEQSPLHLRLWVIGGFVAYLNGTEIARRRAKGEPGFDATAELLYEERDPLRPLEFNLQPHRDLLRERGNILAVHALLDHRFAERHLLRAQIIGFSAGAVAEGQPVHFLEPSPGRPNGTGVSRVPTQPRLQPTSGVFRDRIDVAIRSEHEDFVLRYTLDGSDPDSTAPSCPPRLAIDATCQLRVRAFLGAIGGPVASAQFVRLGAEAATFTSNLPLIVIATGGQPVPIKVFTDGHVHVIDRGQGGKCALADEPQLSCPAAVRIRGSSTLPLAKKGFGIEFRDRSGSDRKRALLGMPADSDWVLYAPHHWDQAHLRNALCYELARRIGIDAPRCRFVELFLCEDTAELGPQHYHGLYLLVESIRVGAERVAIDPLGPEHATEPAITGGYVFKVDRLGPGEVGFEAGGQKLQFVDPPEREITDPQRAWLQQHLDRFGDGLKAEAFRDPLRGYAAFLEVGNAIDYHLYQEFTNNPDAYTLSTYFYKPRNGKIRVGPVWDFDRALRTNDSTYWLGRAGDPFGWTRDAQSGWWSYLFRDDEWRRRYRARGRELLRGPLAVAPVLQLIDDLQAEIAAAEQRDRQRWPVLAPGDWDNEMVRLKRYAEQRIEWMAAELLEMPEYVRDGATVPFELRITGNDEGTLYYTTNGADPALQSRAVSPQARAYDGPLRIDADTIVQARVKIGDSWSRRADFRHFGPVPKLSISEIMYNPPGGHDYEFLEIRNYGDEVVDLRSVQITGAIKFAFVMGKIQTLAPGEVVVVAQDLAKFATRYDVASLPIAGSYYGDCDNTAGDIVLLGGVGQEIARAHYQDDWLPASDGKGYSLVAKRTAPSLRNVEDWQRSPELYGNPGR